VESGQSGQAGIFAAEGGGEGEGRGGDGGWALGPPEHGESNPMANRDGTGGGGGGAGRVRINARSVSTGGGLVSPAATTAEPASQ
jgi:hypothetical protein